MNEIVPFDERTRELPAALAAATTPRQVADLGRRAEGLRQLAKEAQLGLDRQNQAAEARLRCERKLGEMLSERVTRHRPKKSVDGHDAFRLRDAGVSRDLSMRAQRIARIRLSVFERYFRQAAHYRWEITSPDLLYRTSREGTDEINETRWRAAQGGHWPRTPPPSPFPETPDAIDTPAVNLHLGDCLEVMQGVPDQSVDLILADLPYGMTNCAWDTALDLDAMWAQYKRIIKRYHAIVLFAIQPFASRLIMSNPDWFKYEIIWKKPRPSNFTLARHRPMRIHENICVFSEGTTIRKSQSARRMPYWPQGLVATNDDRQHFRRPSAINDICFAERGAKHAFTSDWTNYPTSIIEFPNDQLRLHPTAKPVALCRYLIETYTQPGEIVLDCCMGSGSTGVGATETGRSFIGIEIDDHYFNVAAKRLGRSVPPEIET